MNLFNRLFKKEKPINKVIFIVEDNVVYGKLLEEFLKQKIQGIIDIKLFQTGESCLKEIHEQPSIVVMDHILDANGQAKTGLEVIKEIKEFTPSTHIIVLSSQTDIDVTVDSIKKYNCYYIKKDERSFDKVHTHIKSKWNI